VFETYIKPLFDGMMPVHRDGHKFIVTGLIAAVLLYFVWSFLALLALIGTLWVAFFFRDPLRVTPVRDGLVIAPADGVVTTVGKITPPMELGCGDVERVRISICLGPFDVHVNRAPVAGRIARSVYVPGSFINPTFDKASDDNERRGLVIMTARGEEVALVQIAGQISRRIVTFAGEGDNLMAGQRFGLIRFGSRVDVYLPPDKVAFVAVGQRMIAGETVLADLASSESPREVMRS
jgi:phosphatidylserine decarboxylase